MNNGSQNKYLEMKIQTASPEELAALLFDGALKFLKRSVNELEVKNHENAHISIIKAQNIVAELLLSLDKKRGGEIAANLESIYLYVGDRLIEANVKKEAGPVLESIKILEEIATAWREMMQQSRTKIEAGVNVAG